MSNKIRPPKGYRLLKFGEKYPRQYLSWQEDEFSTTGGYFEGRVFKQSDNRIIAVEIGSRTKPRRKKPTAEQCWDWMRKGTFAIHPYGQKNLWNCFDTKNDHIAKTPLAAVRAAIKSEKGKP